MVKLKGAQTKRRILAATALALMALMMFTTVFTVQAQEISESERFVHVILNSNKGNFTTLDKPVFPVYFNESQIAIGAKWTVTCPLVTDHKYHVYFYGDWINNGTAQTDYDISVYNPKGTLESEHTRAAGLPEHIATGTNGTFFQPSTTGNYAFVITNDARQSNGTQAATFMAIENIECNQWQKRTFEGNSQNGQSNLGTSWAYEFVTDQSQIEVYVKVPASLDMYEVRLYAMTDSDSVKVNGSPLPWEPGLYGNVTNAGIGGYSVDGGTYRGVAYSSCEYRGQQMHLNYTTQSAKKTLYHLVLIAESGSGNVDFLVKTNFDSNILAPTEIIGRVYPYNQTTVAFKANASSLESAVLEYTTDAWKTTTTLNMALDNRTCNVTIPQQTEGTEVEYRVEANDTLMNSLSTEGSFTVKLPATLNITLAAEKTVTGETVNVNGKLNGLNDTGIVSLMFLSANDTTTFDWLTLEDGTLTVPFSFNSSGTWGVQAQFAGTDTVYQCTSNMLSIVVEEPSFYAKNGLYVGGGFLGAVAILAAVAYLRKRRQ